MRLRTLIAAGAMALASLGSAFAQEKQTVTFMAYDVVNFRGALEQFITEFEAKNPDVHIVANFTPDLMTQFLPLLQAGNLNDITFITSAAFVPYLSSGRLEPLPDEYAAKLKTILQPAALAPVTRGDKMYAVPYNFYPNSGVIMYNKALWDAAGLDPSTAKTWEEFMTLAQGVTKHDASGAMTQSGFSAQQEPVTMYFAWLLQYGGKPFNDNGTAAFNSEAGKKALQTYADLYQKWKVDDYEFTATVQGFNQGQVASTMIGPWYDSIVSKDHPNINVGHTVQPPLPGTDPKKPPYWVLQETWSHLVSAQGAKKEATWRFINFLLQPEIAARWSQFSGEMPTVIEALNKPEVVKTPYIAPYVEALSYGSTDDVARYLSSDVLTALQNMLEKVARGQSSIDDALAQAETEVNRLTAHMAP